MIFYEQIYVNFNQSYNLIKDDIKVHLCNLNELIKIMEGYGYSEKEINLIKNSEDLNISGVDRGWAYDFTYDITVIDNDNYILGHMSYMNINNKYFSKKDNIQDDFFLKCVRKRVSEFEKDKGLY